MSLNASLHHLAKSQIPAAASGALAALVLAVAFGGGAVSPQSGMSSHLQSASIGVDGKYECAIGDPTALRSAVHGDSGWDETQIDNATVVYLAAIERGLGDQAAFIALIAAYQESRLYNYANFNVDESLEYDYDKIGQDHDSVGIFQQRPGSGWGSVEDLMNPEHAAGEFYDRLLTIDGWESMEPSETAQAVQAVPVSADGYAWWEGYAASAVGNLSDHITCPPVGGPWTRPVPSGEFWGGFRTSERPEHDGVDIGAEKGAEIVAASIGRVVRVRCDAQLGKKDYSCDVDGSAEVSGCGWYVDIEHADKSIANKSVTRYCHMMSQPLVAVGDIVEGGELIGYMGSSGNSSAPHLHFETHVGGAPATSENAVPPIEFMAERGVSLE